MDRKYVLWAFGYAIVGLALGIYMAASKNHGQLVTHAHIMLVGFLLSFVYGLCHRLWLKDTAPRLALTQYYLHHAGSLVLLTGLFLMYSGRVDADTAGPILGLSSIAVFASLVMMKILFIRSTRAG